MSINNGDTPASPLSVELAEENLMCTAEAAGLTKREHFAAMAMQGMLTSKYVEGFSNEINDDSYTKRGGLANNALRYADALLEELAK